MSATAITKSRRKQAEWSDSRERDRRALALMAEGATITEAYRTVFDQEASTAAFGAVQPKTSSAGSR